MEYDELDDLNTPYWYNYLVNAADRNMVIYDQDSEPGVFSKRLIALMKSTYKNNTTDTIQYMIVDNKNITLDSLHKMNMHVHTIKLSTDYRLHDYINFSLPTDKTNIVLGVGKLNSIIGSF